MKVVLLHNEVDSQTDSAAALDVLMQVKAIHRSLKALGHSPVPIACSLNLEKAKSAILSDRPDVVFNLVESLGGSDRMMPAVTLMLESLSLPVTGSGSRALLDSGDKIHSKHLLDAAGVMTPAYYERSDGSWRCGNQKTVAPKQVIVKSVFEHASVGIDDHSICNFQDSADLEFRMRTLEKQTKSAAMAEQYVDGREFNLSLLEIDGTVQALAPAEILFKNYAAEKPKIVGYRAKWDESSTEYHSTPRNFDFPTRDNALLDRLIRIARKCFEVLGMRGYARVDFRVADSPTHDGFDAVPYVLEVNANPCLSPDAGYAAALEQSGIEFDTAIAAILETACWTNRKLSSCS